MQQSDEMRNILGNFAGCDLIVGDKSLLVIAICEFGQDNVFVLVLGWRWKSFWRGGDDGVKYD